MWLALWATTAAWRVMAQRDGPAREANGSMILAEILEKEGDRIVRWRGRTNFDSLKRGRSYTMLLGEKHVPREGFGQAAFGDGCVYDGQHPASFSRVGGPGYRLGIDWIRRCKTTSAAIIPASASFSIRPDLSVRAINNDINENILGELTTRGK